MDMVDLQNATLSGGVAVGAVADLMIQPYGAFIIGTMTGCISCLSFRALQPWLFRKIGLHDTCGVHNLHGLPGLLSGMVSVIVVYFASEGIYGPGLFLIFPKAAPREGSEHLRQLHDQFPDWIEGSNGRTMGTQAMMQLVRPLQPLQT